MPHFLRINGREALAALDQDCFDLILTDCHMPTMNGFEMTREIRARESASGFSKIPIIAITADAVGHDRQKGIDVGMDAYLTKPVRLGDLSQTLSLYLVGRNRGAVPCAARLNSFPQSHPHRHFRARGVLLRLLARPIQ